jgi:hypothetical protein
MRTAFAQRRRDRRRAAHSRQHRECERAGHGLRCAGRMADTYPSACRDGGSGGRAQALPMHAQIQNAPCCMDACAAVGTHGSVGHRRVLENAPRRVLDVDHLRCEAHPLPPLCTARPFGCGKVRPCRLTRVWSARIHAHKCHMGRAGGSTGGRWWEDGGERLVAHAVHEYLRPVALEYVQVHALLRLLLRRSPRTPAPSTTPTLARW